MQDSKVESTMDKGKKITVLQVLSGLAVGGAESRVMDIARHLDRQKVQYAFLLNTKGPDYYEEEARGLGCEIYRIPRFCFYNYFSYRKAVKDFFASHPEIDIVQGHMTSTAGIYLPLAKKYGGQKTIAHARSAGVDAGLKGTLTKILRKNLWKKTDVMWACSTEAAEAVFGKERMGKVRIIPNAISVDSFEKTEEKTAKANQIRETYGLKDKLVIGHVGRFHYAKNHEFLLEIFAEIAKVREDAALLLVGEGSRMEMIRELSAKLGIEDKVIFAGRQSKVSDFYYAMDLLVFPSRYEGLPGTIVEAQACGLPCVLSDAITKDVAVTPLLQYESLSSSPKIWAQKALEHRMVISQKKKEGSLESPTKLLKQNGFDVVGQVEKLEHYYRELLEGENK